MKNKNAPGGLIATLRGQILCTGIIPLTARQNRPLQAFNHWQEPVYFLKFRHPQTMQVAVGVDRHRLFAAQLKHRLGCLTGGEVAELSAVFGLHKEPLDVVHIHHGVLHRTHRNREGAAGKLCHRQMLFAAGFHRVGEQLLHLFAAADQRNACIVDGGDQVATVLTDIKLCLHIQILHRNVVGVSCGYMITFPSWIFCDWVTQAA